MKRTPLSQAIALAFLLASPTVRAEPSEGREGDPIALYQEGLALAAKKGDVNNLAEASRRFLRAAESGHPRASGALAAVWSELPPDLRAPMLGVFAEERRGFREMIRMFPWPPDGGGRTLADGLKELAKLAAKDGPELRLLLTALGASDPNIQSGAREALASGVGDAATAELTRIYGATEEAFAETVGQVANSARQGDKGASQALAIAARDPDPDIRTRAAEWLGANAGTDPQALAAIQSMASDPDPHIRQSGVFALHAISSRRPELLKILLTASKDADVYVRQTAVIGLAADVIRHNAAATDALIAATKDSDPTVRSKAVEGLGNAIAAGNDKARGFLKTLTSSKDPSLATKAQAYLKKYPIRK